MMRNWNILGIILAVLTTAFPVYGQTPKTVGQLDTQNDVIRNETVPGANTRGRIADMNKSIFLSSPNLFGTYAYPQSWLTGYQPTLVSATNIKTINSTSLLGSGDIVISSGVTNSAANNEFPISNGTNLVGSGFTYTGLFLSIPSGVLKINGNFSVGTFNVTQARRFESEQNSSNANDILYPVRISSTASVTPSVGKGVGIESQVQTGAGNVYKIGGIDEVVSTNVGTGTESFDRVFKTMTSGSAATEKFRITSTGDIKIGSGLSSGTRTITADASSGNGSLALKNKANGSITIDTQSTGTGNIALISGGTGEYSSFGGDMTVGTSGGNYRTIISRSFNATNAVEYPLRIQVSTSGTPSTGIGSGIEFNTKTSSGGNFEIGSTIESVATDVTSTSEDFDIVFKTMIAGATASEKFRIKGDGGIRATATGGDAAEFTLPDVNTNLSAQVFRISHTLSSGSPSVGIGTGMSFMTQTGVGNNEVGAVIDAVTTDVTSTSEDFNFVFKLMKAGAPATTALTISGLGGILGTSTNDAATTGVIGEEINSTISTYTNYTTTATYQNVTSIILTAGDWDISGFLTYSSNGATITAASNSIFVIGTTTASASGTTEGLNIAYIPQAALLGTSKFSETIAPYRVSLSGTTTYYLNAQATFTLGNPQYVGSIRARRIR